MPVKWASLKSGERHEFVCLQIDIAGHSQLEDSERILHEAKVHFHKRSEGLVQIRDGHLFKWEGDGGAFLFLSTESQAFDESVNAAFDILHDLPRINDELQMAHQLSQPLKVRISLDTGVAVYHKKPGLITADFLNSFLKHERTMSLAGAVTITERVHRQLSGPLRGRFIEYKHSAELGCRIYRSKPAEQAGERRVGAVSAPEERVSDWCIDEVLGGWESASNGLCYRLYKLRHHVTGRYDRGKRYDISDLATKDRQKARAYLTRHPTICDKARHPNIAHNRTVFLDGGNRQIDDPLTPWWVVDEWVDGPTLETMLARGPIAWGELKRIMRGVAEGLSALHARDIVRRELSPRFVLVEEIAPGSTAPGRVVLTDFELAKLLDGSPTVARREWPDDPYRAPEIRGGHGVTVQADVYSWAAILVRAATGRPPAASPAGWLLLLEEAKLPRLVKDVARRSLSVLYEERPRDMQVVVRALKSWFS